MTLTVMPALLQNLRKTKKLTRRRSKPLMKLMLTGKCVTEQILKKLPEKLMRSLVCHYMISILVALLWRRYVVCMLIFLCFIFIDSQFIHSVNQTCEAYLPFTGPSWGSRWVMCQSKDQAKKCRVICSDTVEFGRWDTPAFFVPPCSTGETDCNWVSQYREECETHALQAEEGRMGISNAAWTNSFSEFLLSYTTLHTDYWLFSIFSKQRKGCHNPRHLCYIKWFPSSTHSHECWRQLVITRHFSQLFVPLQLRALLSWTSIMRKQTSQLCTAVPWVGLLCCIFVNDVA